MGVPSIRPENEQPVKERLDVGYHRPALRKDLQQATMHLEEERMRLAGLCLALNPGAHKGA